MYLQANIWNNEKHGIKQGLILLIPTSKKKVITKLIVGLTLIITEMHLALFTQVHRSGILIQTGLEMG